MPRKAKNFSLFITCLLASAASIAQHVYIGKARNEDEARIQREIAENLDWHNRIPKTLDGIPDTDRLLYARTNESVLLRQSTGERFGVYESYDEKDHTRTYEIRLHKKSKVTARFLLYGDGCESVNLSAEKVEQQFVLYTASCSNKKYPTAYNPLIYDVASDNFYQFVQLDYDRMENKPAEVSLRDGIYRVRWKVSLRGAKTPVKVNRNFTIMKSDKGGWIVKELTPIDDMAPVIEPLPKLPALAKYDLPKR